MSRLVIVAAIAFAPALAFADASDSDDKQVVLINAGPKGDSGGVANVK